MENLSKIGIDLWSIFLYLLNYGLLLGVLGYFFYPKLLKTIDERRNTIKGNLESAEKLQKELAKQMQEHKEEKDKMMKELQEEKEIMKKDMREKENHMLQEIDSKKETILNEARSQIETEKKELVKDVEKRVVGIMKEIVVSVVSRKVPEDVIEQSVQESWKEYSR